MTMKLSQLRMFIAVVESKSIHRGAAALGVSQPAVSAVIRELETISGGPLLNRSSKGVTVTELGEVLLQRGRALIADMARLGEEMAHVHSGKSCSVSIAVSPITAGVFVPSALEMFRKRMPKVQVSILEISARKVFIQGLRQGEFDFSVVETPNWFFPLPEDIEPLASVDMPLVIGCRATHPLAQSTSIAELAGADWIFPIESDSKRDAMIAEGFARYGLEVPPQPVRSGSMATTLGLLQSMDLIGLFSRQFADAEFERHDLVPIGVEEKLPSLTAGIFQRTARDQTAASACLIACFRDCMRA